MKLYMGVVGRKETLLILSAHLCSRAVCGLTMLEDPISADVAHDGI